MTRTDIINAVAKEIKAKTYLEIGVYVPARNFDEVSAGFKLGVDPHTYAEPRKDILCMTSDTYFAEAPAACKQDLFFIDGLHTAVQSKKDVLNALKHLSTGGVIVMHDCLPKSADAVLPVKPPGGSAWNGEVWKTWRYLRGRKDLETVVVDTDHGVGLIRRGRAGARRVAENTDNTWENARRWANVITPAEFDVNLPGLGIF